MLLGCVFTVCFSLCIVGFFNGEFFSKVGCATVSWKVAGATTGGRNRVWKHRARRCQQIIVSLIGITIIIIGVISMSISIISNSSIISIVRSGDPALHSCRRKARESYQVDRAGGFHHTHCRASRTVEEGVITSTPLEVKYKPHESWGGDV